LIAAAKIVKKLEAIGAGREHRLALSLFP